MARTPEAERVRKRAWKRANPEKVRAAAKAYHQRNRDRRCGQARARYQAKKEMLSAQNAAWKAANPDKVKKMAQARYRARREFLLAQNRAYRTANPLGHREREKRRFAQKKHTLVEPVDYASVLRESGGRCGICEQPLDLFGVHFDHIIPLSKGGTHTRQNIQATHAHCNLRKGAKVA